MNKSNKNNVTLARQTSETTIKTNTTEIRPTPKNSVTTGRINVENIGQIILVQTGNFDRDNISTYAIKNGDIYAWGSNMFGQLWDDSNIGKEIPFKIETMKITPVFSKVSHLSNIHLIDSTDYGGDINLLTTDGDLYHWCSYTGYNSEDDKLYASKPTKVEGLPKIKELCGNYAITYNGTVYSIVAMDRSKESWSNIDIFNAIHTTSKIDGLPPIKKVVTDFVGQVVFFIADNGDVYSWNTKNLRYGSTAISQYIEDSVSPVKINGLSDIVDIATDSYADIYALSKNGKVYAWGSNNNKQLGNYEFQESNVPVVIDYINDVESIYCQRSYTSEPGWLIMLCNDGTVYAPAYLNENNAKGYKQIAGLADIKDIALEQHMNIYALNSKGEVFALGDNHYGQLGNGTTKISLIPAKVIGLENIVSICTQGESVIAVKGNGDIFAWGNNSCGQLGISKYPSDYATYQLDIIDPGISSPSTGYIEDPYSNNSSDNISIAYETRPIKIEGLNLSETSTTLPK